ncbi:antiviral reverse transcriptase Drt5 [Desulforamulus aeronauticus]|nr:antiviral reverse transcriptase Drt5 [Desulforamulus aeronauticus]
MGFVKEDNMKGLFPLRTNLFYIEHGEKELRNFIYNKVFNQNNAEASFLPFPSVYALKDSLHVRKSLQLDPLGTFYFYDFVLRNSSFFQLSTDSKALRFNFGYGFKGSTTISSYKQYHSFRGRKYELKKQYKYFAKVDIANCFNSFYHHDVVSFVSNSVSQQESIQFGQFLREGNGGRSINCFPQGVYPAKVVGNFFLKFIEESRELWSPAIIRFLDDIFLFSNSKKTLEQDIIRIQIIIGKYALSLNTDKTKFGSRASDFEERKLDNIKKSLLKKREKIKNYDEEAQEDQVTIELNPDEVEYLVWLIQEKNVTEEDVELALSLLKEDEYQANRLSDLVLTKYPGLIKNLYQLVNEIRDEGQIWESITNKLKTKFIQEYELFWITRMIIDLYKFDGQSAEILLRIFNHPSATTIVKSAILEITENEYGLFELKDTYLKNFPSGIQATSAIVGLSKLEKAKRNQIYKYAGKASPTMNVLCNIASKYSI